MNDAETRYSTSEKELLAIVWSCKHFRPYLIGRKFTIVTDHKPLQWICNNKDTSSRLMRWRLKLEDYDYEIKYKPGVKNCNADALSRYPVNVVEKSDDVAQEISEDRKLRLLNEMHNDPIGGHLGIQKTYSRLKLYVSWPNTSKDIEKYIQSCKVCQLNKATKPHVKAPLQITDTQNQPWDKIYLDIVGPLDLTELGNKYILTCQDNLSKYVIAIPMQNQTAEEVANKFVYEIILRYGIPNEILTDQGSQFLSLVFQNCCKLMKIKNIFASVYHPESNGALERSHKVLVEYLRCFVDKTKSDWDQWIQFACFTYNTTPHAVTKFTPYELLFGRKANIPGSLSKQPQPLYNMEDLVQDLRQKFQSAWAQAKENLIRGKEKRNDKVNEKRKEVKYQI